MARTRAVIYAACWTDPNWRSISMRGHYLYFLLLTHETTTPAGMAPWAPALWASMSNDMTDGEMTSAAWELERASLLDIDPAAETVTLSLVHGRPAPDRHANCRERDRISPSVRRKVVERDGPWCVVCGWPGTPEGGELGRRGLQIDHKTPVFSGGSSDMENLTVLCAPCNLSKGVMAMEAFIAMRRAGVR